MKPEILIVILFFLWASPKAQDSTALPYNLQQCVETALNNNLQVQQNHLAVERAEVQWKQARANLLPNLQGNAIHGINRGRSIDPFTNSFVDQQISFANYGINSSWTLFNGFSLQNSVRQTHLNLEASRMDLQQSRELLTINVILSYLQVLSAEDVLAQLTLQRDLTRRQVERLEKMNQDGAIAPPQLSDLKGQLANDQLNLVNADNTLKMARLALCQWMNIPYQQTMRLERINLASFAELQEEGPASIYQSALRNLALVKAADLRKQSAEKAVKVAQGNLYPSISLNGNVTTNYSSIAAQSRFLGTTDEVSQDYVNVDGESYPVVYKRSQFETNKIRYADQLDNNLFSSVNVALRIPLFNNFQARNQVKLAKIDQRNSELVAGNTRIQLQQQVEQAYVLYQTSQNRFRTLEEQVAAYGESFRAAEIRFNEGVINSVEYLIQKNNLDRASINLINARYEYVLRAKVLDYYRQGIITLQ